MIVVLGSINIDLVARVERIAAPGETVLGPSYEMICGGKGANQALAARRAGARVLMAGAVGRDGFAQPALAQLRADGVDLTCVAQTDVPTGAAFIAVDAAGQNAITVAAGANAFARAAQLSGITFATGDWLVLQREIPDAEGEAAAGAARAAGAKVILNLAPGGGIPASYLALVDILILNEHEALLLAHALELADTSHDALAAEVFRRGGAACIVTLGPAGAIAWQEGQRFALPAFKVDVIDTTAAGDCFVGAFAAALDTGMTFEAALRHGLAAGSLACTQRGAQPSVPFAAQIKALVAGQHPQ